MKYKAFIYLYVLLFLLTGSTCKNNANELGKSIPEIEIPETGHPRILLLKGEEAQIRNLINSDATWKKMHDAIIIECNAMLTQPELTRVMVGRRLLGTSRELLRRIFFLSYGYRMTYDNRYLESRKRDACRI